MFRTGVWALSLLTMGYVLVGGMRSVAWTDVIQGLLLLSAHIIRAMEAPLPSKTSAHKILQITTKTTTNRDSTKKQKFSQEYSGQDIHIWLQRFNVWAFDARILYSKVFFKITRKNF